MEFLEWYENTHVKNKIVKDDVLFINTCYNKSIIDYEIKDAPKSYNTFYSGRIDITDRAYLNELLSRLQEADNYKYICLDIRFEDGFHTTDDSLLFHRIATMRDIVIPTHYEMKLADHSLVSKSAYSDAMALKSALGFTFYQFVQKDGESIPHRIYRDLTGRHLSKYLGAYFDGKRLCNNNLFIRIPLDYSAKYSQESGNEQLYFDGPEVLDFDYFEKRTANKFIFIGDFTQDLSSTYRGNQPNPYLIYLATKSLFNHDHHITWLRFFTILIIYSGLIFFALCGFSHKVASFKKKTPLMINILINAFLVLFSLIGYNIILYLVQGFIIHQFGIILPVFIPTLVITAIEASSGLQLSNK